MNDAVSSQLYDFMAHWKKKGLPANACHEAKRLLLNQLKASVGASSSQAVKILHQGISEPLRNKPSAHVLWLGTKTTPEEASVINGALFEVLDFHDTYIPCYMHATSAVLPAVMALAEERESKGKDIIDALVLGIEVELAIASMLMPSAYFRGYVPAGLTGSVGAAAACCILTEASRKVTENALSIAMCTSFGLYVSVGSMTLPYITGATARSGLTSFYLAERGFDSALTAFEGDKGMFVTHSDEDPKKIRNIMSSLGQEWRIHGQTYKIVPTETITHGPIELVLELLERSKDREIQKIEFLVCPIVKEICDERMERFGEPNSELTARFDLCFCAAATWLRGKFTLSEMQKEAYSDQEILNLRKKIKLIPDQNRKTFEGCSATVHFTDGTKDYANIDAFLGTPENKVSDEKLSSLFRTYSKGLIHEKQVDLILESIWKLENAKNINELISLLKLA